MDGTSEPDGHGSDWEASTGLGGTARKLVRSYPNSFGDASTTAVAAPRMVYPERRLAMAATTRTDRAATTAYRSGDWLKSPGSRPTTPVISASGLYQSIGATRRAVR